LIQAHVFYSGRVQGVGFRYTTQRRAVEQGVSGWVRNLPDGRVELLAEGPEAAVEKLLENISSDFERYIGNQEIKYDVPQGSRQGFMIRF